MQRTIQFLTEDDEGFEVTHDLPAKYEVCDRCEGTGSHTNPNIDGHGISSEEMRELGDDFRADYLSGVYDVTCHECAGKRVVSVVDRDNADEAILKLYDDAQADEAYYQAECAAERRMGA